MNWQTVFDRIFDRIFNPRNKPEIIKKYFPYLFDDYGFTLSQVHYYYHTSDWDVLLLSSRCRMSFQNQVRDQDGVEVFIGAPWDPPGYGKGPWFRLPLLIAYLNQGKLIWNYEKGSTESQLKRISSVLRPFIGQILEIFLLDAFPEHQPELERLNDKLYTDHLPLALLRAMGSDGIIRPRRRDKH